MFHVMFKFSFIILLEPFSADATLILLHQFCSVFDYLTGWALHLLEISFSKLIFIFSHKITNQFAGFFRKEFASILIEIALNFVNGLILSSSAIAFLFEHFSSYLYSYNDNFPTLWVKNFSGCHRLGVVFLVWCSNGSALMKASLGTLCSRLCHQGFFLSNVLSCDAWQEELPFNQCDNE